MMSFFSNPARSNVLLVGCATIVIIFAIVITASVKDQTENQFSKIITVGPVWRTDNWLCTSTSPFMIHGVLIAYNAPARLEIFVSGAGEQPDFIFKPNEMHSFSVGGVADSSIRISRLSGTITGFITLQTTSHATASCEQI
jgi:hypothetical protein